MERASYFSLWGSDILTEKKEMTKHNFLVEARRLTRKAHPQASKGGASRVASESARLVLAMAQMCDDALIGVNLGGTVNSWNSGATRLFGYTPDEMIGSSFLRVVPQGIQAGEVEVLGSLQPGVPRRYESTRLTNTSERVQITGAICALEDNNGAVIGALRIERELTMKGAGDEARSRLAAIVESSDDAIVSKNLDGIITSWNQAACRMFGHTPEEMIGQPILKIIPPDLHAEEAEILRKIRAGERIEHYETRRLRKDGEIIEVSLTISPVKDGNGNVIGSSKIAREISQRKKMERLLIQSEKLAATGRMAATIAHEINNPLDSVMNLIYLARTSVASNSKALSYLLTAEKELERVSHIARQTLGYYRDPGPPSDVQIEQVLEEVLRVYYSKLVAGNIAVDCAFARHPPITASKDELMQIFSNLIANSVDAMANGGVLTIKTRAVGNEGVEIQVRDKGAGIAPENLERVFEPFFSTKGNLGTGIGLWVARQLLEKRGGSISLESNVNFPANGTTVSVFIPFKT